MTDLDRTLTASMARLAEREVPAGELASPDEVMRRVRSNAAEPLAAAAPRRWPVIAAVAVFALVLAGTTLAFVRHEDPSTVAGPTPPTTDAPEPDDAGPPGWAVALGPGWRTLPAPPNPVVGEWFHEAVVVLAGDELLVWAPGSLRTDVDPAGSFHSGAAAVLDLASMHWRSIDPPDLTWGSGEVIKGGVWTGSEVLVWSVDGVARWSPEQGWLDVVRPPAGRTLTPTDGYRREEGIWIGDEVVFWADGLAFSPALGWRDVPAVPHVPARAAATWDGEEIIVMGMWEQDSPLGPTDNHEVDFAYDPVGKTWRDLPPSGLTPFSFSVTAYGSRVAAADYGMRLAFYDRATNTWQRQPSVPLAASETDMHLTQVGPYLVASAMGMAVLDPDGRWTPTPETTRGTSSDGVLLDAQEQIRVWVPPDVGGARPSRSVWFAPLAFDVPDGFALVGATNDPLADTDQPGRITFTMSAPDGECSLRTRESATPPEWWDEVPDLARVLRMGTISMGWPHGTERAEVRVATTGVVDDDVHAVIVGPEYVPQMEVTCRTEPPDLRLGRAALDNARTLLLALGLDPG